MALSGVNLTSGMRASLYALQQTQQWMETTQTRLSTGKRVNTALDDPINFFAAQGHTQRANDLNFRKDGMGEGIQTIKAADQGISALQDLISAAKALAQSALSGETTSEINALETQYNQLLDQIDDLADDSGYKGTNLLGGTDQALNVKFDETGTSSITVTGFDGSASGLSINDVTANDWVATGGSGDITVINTDIAELDAAMTTLRSKSKALGSQLSTITIREDFTTNMINTLLDGAANLTNADLNEEGANMLMLQTRQALGTTSLSLASQAAQAVLRLF
ncbi:MAG: flagellin [Thermodesulfobacteriota bacterium]|nr:flagellin [Thermodesulfobacteriota bacterium]